MKLINSITAVLAGAAMIIAPSCNKVEDFGRTNQNPNATTEPVTAALLTNVLSQLANTVWGNGITIAGTLYGQYNSETQYTEASRFSKPVFNADAYYAGPLYDLQNIINYNTTNPEKASENGSNANQIAIARILKAYYFWIITDTYGDIPYFNALKGEPNLEYDLQSDIYPDLLKELREAVDQFNAPTGTAADNVRGDILYGTSASGWRSDNAKWRKLANSLRVLIALRMSNAAQAAAQTEINAALTHPAGVIEVNSDNAAMVAPGGIYNHPLYQYYNITQRFDYAQAKTVTDITTATGDARAAAFGSSTVGFPFGLTRDDAVAFANANPTWSYVLAANKRTPTSPMVIIGAAHVWLARAEAIQRGWVTGNYVTAYTTGIQRSWEQWGVYDAVAFAAYLTHPMVDIAVDPLRKILLQQWLAWYPNGTQGWANWRRSTKLYPPNGVPALVPGPGVTLPIPRRIPYGPNDYNFNLANVQVAGARYTVAGETDSQNGRVWWDN